MSSPTRPQPSDAVVRRSGEITGPIRLPREDSQLFIDAFNRLYRTAGLSIGGTVPSAESESAQQTRASAAHSDAPSALPPASGPSSRNPDDTANRH